MNVKRVALPATRGALLLAAAPATAQKCTPIGFAKHP